MEGPLISIEEHSIPAEGPPVFTEGPPIPMESPPMTGKGPPIPTEWPSVPIGGLLIPQYEAFRFFAILHLSFFSLGKRFCGSAKVVRFELILKFRGGNATPAPMVAPPLAPRNIGMVGTAWTLGCVIQDTFFKEHGVTTILSCPSLLGIK